MNGKELAELEMYFSKTYGGGHSVPASRVKPIDAEKAKLLFSLRIPICFKHNTSFIVCNGWNPFSARCPIDEQWYAWIDKEQEDGDRQ